MRETFLALWAFFLFATFGVRFYTDDIRASAIMLMLSMVCLAGMCVDKNVVNYLVPFCLIVLGCAICILSFISYQGDE